MLLLMILLVSISILFSSCGSNANEKQDASVKPRKSETTQTSQESSVPVQRQKEPIFVAFLAGRSSCQVLPTIGQLKSRRLQRDYEQFGKFLTKVESQISVKPRFLLSCIPANGNPSTDPLKYFTSSDELKAGNVLPAEVKLSSFLEALVREARGASKVYIVGHSYGGWTAMKAAEFIARERKISALMTVDPISAITCTPMSGAMDFFKSGAPASCNQSPSDFTSQSLQTIRSNTGAWINVFQTANQSLHSGPIPLATENMQLTYQPVRMISGLMNPENPHYFTITDAKPWEKMLQEILQTSAGLASR